MIFEYCCLALTQSNFKRYNAFFLYFDFRKLKKKMEKKPIALAIE